MEEIGSRLWRLHDHDDEVAGSVHAFDPAELDVAGRRRAADPGQWPAADRGRSEQSHSVRHVEHDLIGPHDDIVCASEAHGIDFEAEVAVITGDVKAGATPEQADFLEKA